MTINVPCIRSPTTTNRESLEQNYHKHILYVLCTLKYHTNSLKRSRQVKEFLIQFDKKILVFHRTYYNLQCKVDSLNWSQNTQTRHIIKFLIPERNWPTQTQPVTEFTDISDIWHDDNWDWDAIDYTVFMVCLWPII